MIAVGADHRAAQHRHCRRILRSPERAEDAVQETADLLGSTVPAVNSALQRARATLRAAGS